MKLIINTSNLDGGGGVQVAISFLNECLIFNENEYHVFLCPKILNQINLKQFPNNYFFYNFPVPPKPTFLGLQIIQRLRTLEAEIKPDCVFTVFGPSYWTPKAPHLMGFANPHFLYPNSLFYSLISAKENIKWKLLLNLKRYFFKRNSEYFHAETDVVRLRLSQFINCSINNIFTVSNTHSNVYNNFIPNGNLILPNRLTKDEFRFVCISAYYVHKNLEILNGIIPLLIESGYDNIKFILTISDEMFESRFSEIAKKSIINVGPIDVVDCPQLYSECDALFLPTLLECFTASYLEAMVMKLPILTTDLPFAHDICGESALYFKPLSVDDASSNILKLYNDEVLRNKLAYNGVLQLNKFDTSNQRAKKYLDICKSISKK